MTTIELGPKDSAIIIREDLSEEVVIPDPDKDGLGHGSDYLVCLLAIAFRSDKMLKKLDKIYWKIHEKRKKEEDND